MCRQLALVFTVCLVLSGCGLQAVTLSVSRPPQDEVAARKWWEESVASTDVAYLRRWYQASEVLRQRGASATYLRHQYLGQSMAGSCYADEYFPSPIPADLLPKVQARLAREKSEFDSSADLAAIVDLVRVEDCKNCTKLEAWEAWKRHL
jgi:hypothetical protein